MRYHGGNSVAQRRRLVRLEKVGRHWTNLGRDGGEQVRHNLVQNLRRRGQAHAHVRVYLRHICIYLYLFILFYLFIYLFVLHLFNCPSSTFYWQFHIITHNPPSSPCPPSPPPPSQTQNSATSKTQSTASSPTTSPATRSSPASTSSSP